jgi:hypothetical protein
MGFQPVKEVLLLHAIMDRCFSNIKTLDMNPISIKLQAPWDEVKRRMKENDPPHCSELVYEPGHEEELLMRLEKL